MQRMGYTHGLCSSHLGLHIYLLYARKWPELQVAEHVSTEPHVHKGLFLHIVFPSFSTQLKVIFLFYHKTCDNGLSKINSSMGCP